MKIKTLIENYAHYLNEIALSNAETLPYTWVSHNRAEFTVDNMLYAVTMPDKSIESNHPLSELHYTNGVSLGFGTTLYSKSVVNYYKLTNKPDYLKTVLSTVSKILIDFLDKSDPDYIDFIHMNPVSKKRANVYKHVLDELKNKLQHHGFDSMYVAPQGTEIVLYKSK